MRKNPVKAALKAGKPQVGTWLTLASVFAGRIMARAGFPWLTVDMEHTPINWETAGQLFGTIADAGCTVLARVPGADHNFIKKVLDSGAQGIVVPMVNTVEEARLVVNAAKYPPIGRRSVGGTLHALNYNATAGEYFKHADNEVLVILQTESPEGIRNAPEIYRTPGVDAIFVGPNDLAAQMRGPDGREATPEEFEAALQTVLRIGKEAGMPVGLHCTSVEQVNRRIAEGWQFIALGSETRFMVSAAQAAVQALQLTTSEDLARY
jgi:4-hydroxy-2-oxoheptanedioate aldolase